MMFDAYANEDDNASSGSSVLLITAFKIASRYYDWVKFFDL